MLTEADRQFLLAAAPHSQAARAAIDTESWRLHAAASGESTAAADGDDVPNTVLVFDENGEQLDANRGLTGRQLSAVVIFGGSLAASPSDYLIHSVLPRLTAPAGRATLDGLRSALETRRPILQPSNGRS